MSFKFDGTLLTSDRTLVNGQVIGDMGLVDGSMTVTSTGSGNVIKIENDRAYQKGATSAPGWNQTRNIYTPETTITDQSGQVLGFDVEVTSTDGAGVIGYGDSADSADVGLLDMVGYLYFQHSDLGIYYSDNAGLQGSIANYVSGTAEKFRFVFDGAGNLHIFQYDGVSAYNLLYISAYNTVTGNFDFRTGIYNYLTAIEAWGITIPDTLQPALVTPIIHDAFGGSGTTDGRTPDTVNQGDTWHNTWFTLSDGVVASGYMESDGDGSVVLRTNCGQDDQYSITNGTINNTTTSNSRFGNLHRVQDTSDDGFPTDCVRCMLVPLTNELQIIERIAGSNTTTSTAFTVVGATTYDLHSWVVGTKAFAQVNGTSVSATLGTITSGTQCGVELAAQTSIPHTLVNDHKTYKANGVTINV